MYRNTGEKSYRIYKKIMYDAKYRSLANEYTESLNRLQEASQTFSEDQWQAVKAYQESFMSLHNAMMEIALRNNR